MFLKGLCLFFLGAGVFVLMQVIMPVVAFQWWQVTTFDQSQLLVDPRAGLKPGYLVDGNVLGVSVEDINNFPAFYSSKIRIKPYEEFKISIPSIKMDNETVKVFSNEFNKNLALLPGMALPGEKGNVFITGHSSVSRAVQSKDSRAIFVGLPGIKKGDEIQIEALGQKFKYQVVGLKIVDPKDVSVLNPPDAEGRYITLMTCVPPGFNTKRLIVLGRLK